LFWSRAARGSEKVVSSTRASGLLRARIGGIDLQFEGGELGRLLLFSTELLKAGLKAVGEQKWHGLR
jgi:hypothetical protein